MHAGVVVHCVLERKLHVGLEEHLASPHDTLVEGHLDGGGGDVTKDGVEVVQSEGDQVARVVTHEHLRTSSSSGGQNVPHLVFHRHGHQVIELVHAVRVQPHYGGVGQLVEHRLQHLRCRT